MDVSLDPPMIAKYLTPSSKDIFPIISLRKYSLHSIWQFT